MLVSRYPIHTRRNDEHFLKQCCPFYLCDCVTNLSCAYRVKHFSEELLSCAFREIRFSASAVSDLYGVLMGPWGKLRMLNMRLGKCVRSVHKCFAMLSMIIIIICVGRVLCSMAQCCFSAWSHLNIQLAH